jgi:methyl-accepting chemotaxis protein
MKLRSKMLLALVSVSVIPLVISLLMIGGMVSDELEVQMQVRAQDSANFVEQTTTRTSTENLTLVQMLASNPFMVNAVYSAGLSNDNDQLVSVINNMEDLPFDQIQVLDKEGARLYRSFANGYEEIPATSGVEQSVIEASLEGEDYAESGMFDGRMAITAAAPISMYGEPIGHLVGVTFFDKTLATIAFFDETGVFAATSPELAAIELKAILQASSYEAEIGGKKHRIFYNSIGGKNRGVLMALDVTKQEAANSNLQQALLLITLIVAVISVIIGLLVATGIIRPLREVVANLREISAGGGDLSRELDVRTSDEVGELSECFNAFLARQREMVKRLREVTKDLAAANGQIRNSSHEVMEGAVRQSQALELVPRSHGGRCSSITGPGGILQGDRGDRRGGWWYRREYGQSGYGCGRELFCDLGAGCHDRGDCLTDGEAV